MTLSKQAKKAVEDSIKHWVEDIVGPLEGGDKIIKVHGSPPIWKSDNAVVLWGSASCPLCVLYFMKSCAGCPLAISLDGCCDDDSPYLKFVNNPTLPHALNMVKALEEILEVEG